MFYLFAHSHTHDRTLYGKQKILSYTPSCRPWMT